MSKTKIKCPKFKKPTFKKTYKDKPVNFSGILNKKPIEMPKFKQSSPKNVRRAKVVPKTVEQTRKDYMKLERVVNKYGDNNLQEIEYSEISGLFTIEGTPKKGVDKDMIKKALEQKGFKVIGENTPRKKKYWFMVS